VPATAIGQDTVLAVISCEAKAQAFEEVLRGFNVVHRKNCNGAVVNCHGRSPI
jgi:hypothetical protein